MAELFRTRLLGYSKKDVNDYLAKMNEDFSRKLLEKELEGRKEIQAVQEELDRLKKENEQLRNDQQEVAMALINAKVFARELKQQAELEDRAQREKNTALQNAEAERIRMLTERISGLWQSFRSTLEGMERELEIYSLTCRQVQSEIVPEAYKPEPEEADELEAAWDAGV